MQAVDGEEQERYTSGGLGDERQRRSEPAEKSLRLLHSDFTWDLRQAFRLPRLNPETDTRSASCISRGSFPWVETTPNAAAPNYFPGRERPTSGC